MDNENCILKHHYNKYDIKSFADVLLDIQKYREKWIADNQKNDELKVIYDWSKNSSRVYSVCGQPIHLSWYVDDKNRKSGYTFITNCDVESVRVMEELRKCGVFKKVFGSDFPNTVQTYKLKGQIAFIFEKGDGAHSWKDERERELIRKKCSQTIFEQFFVMRHPEVFEQAVEYSLPQTYKNVDKLLEGKSYYRVFELKKMSEDRKSEQNIQTKTNDANKQLSF